MTSPSATGWTTDPRSSPLLDLLGPVLVRPEPNGSLSVALVVEQRHCNNRGSLHGGVLTALGDVALGRSAAMLTDPPTGLVTVSLEVHFAAAARPGNLVEVHTTTRRATRSMVFAQGEATVDETVIALLTAAFRRLAESH